MNIETANRLVQLRKKNNLSQEALAEKLGISRQAISKWERAEACPDIDNLLALSKIYDVSLDELIKPEEQVTVKALSDQADKQLDEQDHEQKSAPPPKSKFNWVKFPYPVLMVIIFFILRLGFDVEGPAWLVFLTIPIFYWFVNPKNKEK
ncbi:MAG: helix-turn-helix domain-containing protein [Bacillota bacterium]